MTRNSEKLFGSESSRKCISKFPIEVKRTIGHALYFAQVGDRHPQTKMMKGLGSGVYEIFEDHRSGTFRAVYTIKQGNLLKKNF
jgi:phage-related protein